MDRKNSEILFFLHALAAGGTKQQPTAHQNGSFLSLAWKGPASADQMKFWHALSCQWCQIKK